MSDPIAATAAGAAGLAQPTDPLNDAGPPDYRLVLPAFAAWAAALLPVPASAQVAVGSAALLAAATSLLVQAHARRGSGSDPPPARTGFLVVACLAAAGAVLLGAGLRAMATSSGPLPGWAADRAQVHAAVVVTGDPVGRQSPTAGSWRSPGGYRIPVRIERVDARGTSIRTRVPALLLTPSGSPWDTLLPSQHLELAGRLLPPRDGTPYLLPVDRAVAVGTPSGLQRLAGELRAGLHDAADVLPPAERGLLPGLVLGDTSGMPRDLENDFRTAGLTHLVAVSGANVAFVLGAVLFGARWAGVRGRALPAVGLLAMGFFLVLTRAEPSVLRATVMGVVAVVALVRGGRRAGVPALGAAVIGLLLVDPALGRSYGFALSVLATAALLVVAPGWSRGLSRWMPRPLAAAIAVPAAAQAVCAPVVVVLSGSVSLVAIPANLAVAPAVAPATVLGVVAAAVAPVAPPAAEACVWLAGWPTRWIVSVAQTSAALPHASLGWPGGWGGAVLLAALTIAGVASARRWLRHPRALVSLGIAVAVAMSPWGARVPWPPPGWVMVACDVGQGDGLVLASAPGHAVVVDSGPDPDAMDRCLDDLGVRTVDALLLTHLHADHVEGLPGVLRGRAVGALFVGPLAEPADEAERVSGWVADAGVSVRRAQVGDVVRVGAVTWQVLWPTRLIRGEGSDANNASLVLLVDVGGVRLLLTGDVEAPAQRALLRLLPPDLDVDVLKVAHHGSANQDPRLLAAAHAELAVVPVGEDNPYGHPAPELLATLEALGTAIARTDQHGDIAVVVRDDEVTLAPRR